jgi:hypothetical protein
MCGFPTHSNDSTDGWCSLEELGVLSKLKALEIRGLEKAPSGSMAAKAMLSNKHHLIGLELMFTSRLGENGEVKDDISEAEHERTEEVLANLCPPTCIEELEITAYFELTIWNCILQRLPPGLSYHALGLRELDLRNNTHLVSIENFPSLVKLLSYGNPRIERINNNPNLQWIEISECPALKELNSLPSLQSLEWWDWMLKHCHNTYETQS